MHSYTNNPRSWLDQSGRSNRKQLLASLLPTLAAAILLLAFSLLTTAQENTSELNGTLTAEAYESKDNLFESEGVLQQQGTESNIEEPDSPASNNDSQSTVRIDTNSQSDQSTSDSTVSIRISTNQTDAGGQGSAPEPSISVNGEDIEIPENGRIREKYEDENSTTRIRANIDSDNSSSISISTNGNYSNDSEGD